MTGELRMLSMRVRRRRVDAGLTQAQLAARAGVSRQLIGAIEAGRHLPRVDAGVALARALGVSAEELLEPEPARVTGVVGPPPMEGAPVRVGRVGDRLVCANPPMSGESWAPAEGVVGHAGIDLLPGAQPGAVVVGCDPAIGLAERLLGRRGAPPVLAVSASTAAALEALAGGRAHAAVVHGPEDGLPEAAVPTRRWRLARWRVGLTGPPESSGDWWQDALTGRRQVVQREPGAAAQAAFERAIALRGGARPAGPVATGHVEAAQRARSEGLVAVSIEPVALAAGLPFHPLEAHVTQLWVAEGWVGEPGIIALQEQVASSAFQQQLAAVGGYDLAGCGTAV